MKRMMSMSNISLQNQTGGEMLSAVKKWEETRESHRRSRVLRVLVVGACRRVAVLLERARKQAALCRPRLALDAVDEARACLTSPIPVLQHHPGMFLGVTNENNTASGEKSKDGNATKLREQLKR